MRYLKVPATLSEKYLFEKNLQRLPYDNYTQLPKIGKPKNGLIRNGRINYNNRT